MLNRNLIIWIVLLSGCASLKNSSHIHNPIETVIKFKSVQDYCIKDSSVLSLIDIRSTFNLSEKQNELAFWYDYIDLQCSVRDGKKTDDCTNYSNCAISSQVKKKNARIEIIHNETNLVESYQLVLTNERWRIINFSFR